MTDRGMRPLRVVALVKQVPVVEELRLGTDGRLERSGVPTEMSAYCRRAVAKGVELARDRGGSCAVVTLGPPSAEDVLREAVAFGADRGVHLTDPAFAGSDTLATAGALAAAVRRLEDEQGGPFDLVLVGRNSVDADTGQVGPELAELLDRPFVTGVKRLAVDAAGTAATVGLEHDDAWVEATVELPAVLSTAERLIDPCKIKDPAVWATVDPGRIERLTAADLGPGPWGQDASPTVVGEIRTEVAEREGRVLGGPLEEQVRVAAAVLADRGLLAPGTGRSPAEALPPTGGSGPAVAVLVEPGRGRLTAELLSGAARLAAEVGGPVVALVATASIPGGGGGSGGPDAGREGDAIDVDVVDVDALASWGADRVVELRGATVEEDVAAAAATWTAAHQPWAVLAGSTAWGREVASRLAARLGAGLTGDAVGLAVREGRLVAWKPAFGGTLVAAVTSRSPVQLVTIRGGVLPVLRPRRGAVPEREVAEVAPRGRVRVLRRHREDDVDLLLNADRVVGVGRGVEPDHYDELDPLLAVLGAELAATRKVTDQGHLPHARQIGITGHSISPRLFVSIGASGRYNHTVGIRSAGTVLAINPDASAPIFPQADLGIVGEWRTVVPLLVRELAAVRVGAGDGSGASA